MSISVFMSDNLSYELEKDRFKQCSKMEALKYLKGIYSNRTRLEVDFLDQFAPQTVFDPVRKFMLDSWDDATKFTYEEAFQLKDQAFQRLVFTSVDIAEMMENLGKEKVKTDGIHVSRKVFDREGEYIGDKEYDNVYETYRIGGSELGLVRPVYAVRCWCTSTENEHWLWIDENYAEDPLAAIASTFHMHENVIPHITELKRQGDIMLVELDGDITPEGRTRPLTKEEYFGLLTSET